jgi:hypothetical protein
MADHTAIIVYSSGSEEPLDRDFVSTPHLASSLLDEGIYDEDGLQQAMEKAMLVCMQVRIPIRRHFRRLHVRDGHGQVEEDWALSDFALYLLLLNGNVALAPAAYAQAYAIYKAFAPR